MSIRAATSAIRKKIAEGQTDDAFAQLIDLLDSNKAYAELLRYARINQADWFQLKSKSIKGVITNAELRLATNQINDKLLEVLDLVDAGKFTLDTPEKEIDDERPPRQAWRYYLAGGIVALAIGILLMTYFGKKKPQVGDNCPPYTGNKNWKIDILPFRQSGDKTSGDEALEIADGLNKLIEGTPGMEQVVAIVDEGFDIASKYPTPDEATQIAINCDAKMIVWGRIKLSGSDENYKLDMRYKLLDDSQTAVSGDTTISKLLKMSDGGQLIRDLEAVTKRLYEIIANRLHIPVEKRAFKPASLAFSTLMTSSLSPAQVDSMVSELHASVPEGDTSAYAESVYTQILSIKEDSIALVKRGAIRASKKNYKGAIEDWENAAFDPKKANPDLLRLRLKAYEQTGDLDKATKDLTAYASKQPKDSSWVKSKAKALEGQKVQKIAELDSKERTTASKTKQPTNKIIDDAKAMLKTGQHDKAKQKIGQVSPRDAKNPAVIGVKVDIEERVGGPKAARKEVEKAKKVGVTPKEIEPYYPHVKKLEEGNY